jgi:hypothetical protein
VLSLLHCLVIYILIAAVVALADPYGKIARVLRLECEPFQTRRDVALGAAAVIELRAGRNGREEEGEAVVVDTFVPLLADTVESVEEWGWVGG